MEAVPARELIAAGLITTKIWPQLMDTVIVAAIVNGRDIEEGLVAITLESDLALDDIVLVAGLVLAYGFKHAVPALRETPDLAGWRAVHVVVWDLVVEGSAGPLRTRCFDLG